MRTQPVGENSNINHSVAECDFNIQDKGSGGNPVVRDEGEKREVAVSTATLVPGPKPLGLNIDLNSQQGLTVGSGKVLVPTQPSSPPQPPQQSLSNSPPQQPFEVTQVNFVVYIYI